MIGDLALVSSSEMADLHGNPEYGCYPGNHWQVARLPAGGAIEINHVKPGCAERFPALRGPQWIV
jgi:hypothetical protein